MTDIDLTAARGLSVEDLRAGLTQALERVEAGFRESCIYVTALRERGEKLPDLPAAFKFARKVAEGVLTPHSVMTLAHKPGVLEAMAVLPHDWQDRLADGERIPVAVRSNAGRITSLDKTVAEMDGRQMALAFSEEGITPIEEQQAFLHRQGNVSPLPEKPRPKLRVDQDTDEIVVNGRVRLRVDDLKGPLLELGLMVKPVYSSRSKAG